MPVVSLTLVPRTPLAETSEAAASLPLGQVSGLFTHGALAAAGAAAVAIPIVIHLLTRLRQRSQPFAAMRFLLQAFEQQKRRLRLEQWLLLLLRCLAILAVGLALGAPVVRAMGGWGDWRPARHMVLIFDDGLSTQTIEGDMTRFSMLQWRAQTMLARLGPRDRVSLWRAAKPVRRGANEQADEPGEGVSESAPDVGSEPGLELGAGAGPGAEPELELGEESASDAERGERLDRAELARRGDGTYRPSAAARLIASWRARDGRSDLAAALEQAAAETLERDLSGRELAVAVVSDFAAGSLAVERRATGPAAQMLERARTWLTRPIPTRSNVQVSDVSVRPRTVLSKGPGAGQAAVRVTLRRMQADGAGSTRLLVEAGASETRRTAKFEPGKRELTLEVPIRLSSEAMGRTGLAVTASVRDDALSADNTRRQWLEIRESLNVTLVAASPSRLADGLSEAAWSEAGAGGQADEATPTDPARWIEAAVGARADSGVSLNRTRPEAADFDALDPTNVQAVILTAPQALSESAWKKLAAFARAGGLVWITPDGEGRTGAWRAAFNAAFNTPWTLAFEARRAPASTPLASQTGPPATLERLAPDWASLLKPVVVDRYLAVDVNRDANIQPPPTLAAGPAASANPDGDFAPDAPRFDGSTPGDADDSNGAGEANGSSPRATTPPQDKDAEVWIRMAGPGAWPFMLSRRVGHGRLVLLTVALDPSWTNLPAKPLFVPLVHEMLRLSLRDAQGAESATVGERVWLDDRWSGVSELRGPQTLRPTPAWQTAASSRETAGGASGSASSPRSGARSQSRSRSADEPAWATVLPRRAGVYLGFEPAGAGAAEAEAEAEADQPKADMTGVDMAGVDMAASAGRAGETAPDEDRVGGAVAVDDVRAGGSGSPTPIGAGSRRARVLVANVDPAGGVTRPLDERALRGWFDVGLADSADGGGGTDPAARSDVTWFAQDAADPFAAGSPDAAAQRAGRPLAWPLLWTALGLLLLETCLARWFSHARTHTPGSLVHRTFHALQRVGH